MNCSEVPEDAAPMFYVAARGHQADIGGAVQGGYNPEAREVWQEARDARAVPLIGGPATMLPDQGGVDVERMVRAFRLGLKDLLPVWEQIMPDTTLTDLYPLPFVAPDEFRFAPRLWARVVGDFAVAHHPEAAVRRHGHIDLAGFQNLSLAEGRHGWRRSPRTTPHRRRGKQHGTRSSGALGNRAGEGSPSRAAASPAAAVGAEAARALPAALSTAQSLESLCGLSRAATAT